MRKLVIGTRGSPLALRQTEWVRDRLRRHHPELSIGIRVVRTTGDRLSEANRQVKQGSKGIFVKEIEEAMLRGEIDLAVHSLKDVPAHLPDGLSLSAYPPREEPFDVLVGRERGISASDLPGGARVGTSSLRRGLQLRALRPDLRVVPVRGNVGTRIARLDDRLLDGLVLAGAGLIRLGLEDRIGRRFPLEEMVPAAGQGALALETRADEGAVLRLVEPLDDPDTRDCVKAERLVLERLGGGCEVPVGVLARVEEQRAGVTACVADPASGRLLKHSLEGRRESLSDLARELAERLLREGAAEVLRPFRAGGGGS